MESLSPIVIDVEKTASGNQAKSDDVQDLIGTMNNDLVLKVLDMAEHPDFVRNNQGSCGEYDL